MTLFVDNPIVERLLTMRECMDALEEAHAEFGRGRAVNGPIFRLLTPRDPAEFPGSSPPVHHVFTSLSAAIQKWNVVANREDSDFTHYPVIDGSRRLVRIPGQPSGMFCGFVNLYDSRSAELFAVIHDGYMQKFRVGGTIGLATKHLAKRDAKVLALIGTGWQATAAIQAHCAARDFELVKIYSPTRANREAFARDWSAALGVEMRAVDSAEEAVRGADVVSTVTNAVDPVIRTEWLEPGMLVTTLKDSNEIEYETFLRADLVVSNRRGIMFDRQVIGGFESSPEHGKEYWGRPGLDWENLPLFGEIVAGIRPGRTSDDQIVAMMVKGDGLQFAAVAYRVYELARKAGLGTEVDSGLWLQDKKYIP